MNSIGLAAFLFLGGAGQFGGLGCHKCTHSLKALSHLWPVLASLTFLHLDIFMSYYFFFLNCLGPTRASFPKNTAHCFFFSCCSSSLFLPDSHNRMHCIVLIKRMNFLTLEKLQMRVGDLMLSGMHNALCPLKHLESHFR